MTECARAVIETYMRIDLSRRDAAFILPALVNPAFQRTGQRYRHRWFADARTVSSVLCICGPDVPV